MKILIWILASMTALAAAAQEPTSVPGESQRTSVRAMIAVGNEFRPEKDAEANFTDQKLSNQSLGIGYRNYLFILERASFQEISGNATLGVTRKLEDLMIWGLWQGERWYGLSPFAGLGLGAYKETVTTSLSGAESRTNQTRDKLLGGGSFGIALQIPVIWVSLEARMLFGDELNPQPSMGAVGRIGLWF